MMRDHRRIRCCYDDMTESELNHWMARSWRPKTARGRANYVVALAESYPNLDNYGRLLDAPFESGDGAEVVAYLQDIVRQRPELLKTSMLADMQCLREPAGQCELFTEAADV